MNNKTAKWIIVAVVAAVVAAVTTVVVLALRARAKKKAWYEEEAAFDYDLDDDVLLEELECEPDAIIENTEG